MRKQKQMTTREIKYLEKHIHTLSINKHVDTVDIFLNIFVKARELQKYSYLVRPMKLSKWSKTISNIKLEHGIGLIQCY